MSTISLEIPPLRQRGADVELLARHFVAAMNERFTSSKQIGDAALAVLRRHNWPGNVRELLHAVEGAMVVCEGPEILPQHLPSTVRGAAAKQPLNGMEKLPTLDELERSHIRLVMQVSEGHRGNAARILGISERNLYRKLHDLGLLA
jgi:DNA-binding NtrC family response regulator